MNVKSARQRETRKSRLKPSYKEKHRRRQERYYKSKKGKEYHAKYKHKQKEIYESRKEERELMRLVKNVSKLITAKNINCYSCGNKFLDIKNNGVLCEQCNALHLNKWSHIRYVLKRGEKNCKCCDKPFFHLEMGATQDYCSIECRDKQNKINIKKRGKTHKRSFKKRAEQFGVFYQPVNRIKVFKRDRWRCKECGVKVKRTVDPIDNQAHLGHIVPMSLGGSHTYTNCQCECRACNLDKGNKVLGQQLTIYYSGSVTN